jgi:hypothetical protein
VTWWNINAIATTIGETPIAPTTPKNNSKEQSEGTRKKNHNHNYKTLTPFGFLYVWVLP